MPNGLSSLNNFHMHVLLAMLERELLSFESLKDWYMVDANFNEAYDHCHEGFLFKENVYVCPRALSENCWLRRHTNKDLMGHFGMCKTYEALRRALYMSKMLYLQDDKVQSIVQWFVYPSPPIPTTP
ncbi:hypothetical protein CR513_46865, partial [Mucuna pruriens]